MKRLSVVFLFVACSQPPPHIDVVPNPKLVNNARICDSACQRLRDLNCIDERIQIGLACNGDWECNPGDDCVDRWCVSTCESVCIDGAMNDPVCTSRATSCDAAELCHKQ